MINSRRWLAVTALTATIGLAGCGSPSMSGHEMGHPTDPAGTSSAAAPANATPAVGPHNDADVMFAQMMIPHHQQAVTMSSMILAKDGLDAPVTELATTIKNNQAPEIARMSGWLAGWGADPSPAAMHHGGDDGMLTDAELTALDQAGGAEASRLFLSGMIGHHEGAVTMARSALTDGENPEAHQLAQAIITSQRAEISEMTELLAKY